jgi:hypothetical protein
VCHFKQPEILNIEVDHKEIISLHDFELKWRWEKTHNPDISETEKTQLRPVSEIESKRLNKVIDYFEIEGNLKRSFVQTDWISANSENNETTERFRKELSRVIEPWDEGIIVTWNRTTTMTTTREIFLKYWDDFCYPSSDDVTIISEKTNWVLFYRHFGVANIWTRQKTNTQHLP